MTMHKSGLEPIGKAVLVEPYEPEVKKSLIAIPDTVRERTVMVETRAIVLAMGDQAAKDGRVTKIGQKVLISQYCGAMAQGPKDGKTYRLVNIEDIYCLIED